MSTPEGTTERGSTRSNTGLRAALLGIVVGVAVTTGFFVSKAQFNPNTYTSAEVALASQNATTLAFIAGQESIQDKILEAYEQGVDDEAEWCVGYSQGEYNEGFRQGEEKGRAQGYEEGRDEGYELGLEHGKHAGDVRCEADISEAYGTGYNEGWLNSLLEQAEDGPNFREWGPDGVGATVGIRPDGTYELLIDDSSFNYSTLNGTDVICNYWPYPPNIIPYFTHFMNFTLTTDNLISIRDNGEMLVMYPDGSEERIPIVSVRMITDVCYQAEQNANNAWQADY
ncbi:MAG: hypothetical protein ACP5N7_06435 [Candidatus Pacearchaeota archaeon]